jgi:hypothetical protein
MTPAGVPGSPRPARQPVLNAIHPVQQQAQRRQQQHSDGDHGEKIPPADNTSPGFHQLPGQQPTCVKVW